MQASEFHHQADFSSLPSRLCVSTFEVTYETSERLFEQPIELLGLNVQATSEARAWLSGGPFAQCLTLPVTDRENRDEWMVFDSLLAYSRFFSEAASSKREATSGSTAVALDGREGDVYSEETFRHFLGIERLRAARSERQFLLLLVSLRHCPQRGVRFSPGTAASLLDGLGLCVREVDFIGWYRHERVAGAVLAQGFEGPDSEAPSRIVDRVVRVLSERLPNHAADRLRVRVVRLGAPAQ